MFFSQFDMSVRKKLHVILLILIETEIKFYHPVLILLKYQLELMTKQVKTYR